VTQLRNERPIRLGIVGVGKIARDQHLPAIAANPSFELVATASPGTRLDGVPGYDDIASLLEGGHDLDAVSICTPPAGRHEIAAVAIGAGLHAMLEKPPAASLSEVADLEARAVAARTTLFAAWHSREAAGVDSAREWLADRQIVAARIAWKEDIRRWHPGQEWILGAGGFGVFDPGINALSILTAILPDRVMVEAAQMEVPKGRASPIAARLTLKSGGAQVDAVFDFLQTGPQNWDIEVDTDLGTLTLAMGGSILTLPGEAAVEGPDREYARLYARFATLIREAACDVDVAPLRLVADAFLLGERQEVASFAF